IRGERLCRSERRIEIAVKGHAYKGGSASPKTQYKVRGIAQIEVRRRAADICQRVEDNAFHLCALLAKFQSSSNKVARCHARSRLWGAPGCRHHRGLEEPSRGFPDPPRTGAWPSSDLF